MPVKLTETLVKQALADVAAKAKAYDLIDTGCPGLLLRVGPRGARFAFKFESGHKTHRLTLGSPETIRLAEARAIATEARRRLVDRIGIPDDRFLEAQLRKLRKLEPKAEPPPRDPAIVQAFEDDMLRHGEWTWEDARAAYLAEVARVRRPDTHTDYRKMLSLPELAVFEGRRVRRITIEDLATIVHAVHASGRERHAEHLASVLRPMWSYLARHEHKKKSGVDAGMPQLKAPERTSGDKPRANGKVPGGYFASAQEIGYTVAVARSGVLEPSLGVAMELMVLTGQRRRPVASAEVADFVEFVEQPGWGVWAMRPIHRKTAAKRGDKTLHCVPLPPALWQRLQVQVGRAGKSKFLFPQVRPRKSGGTADGHLSASALNHRLLDMGVRASPHDLRRGLSSLCQTELRILPATVEMILDHSEGVPTDNVLERHYTNDKRLDLKVPVMEAWISYADRQFEAAAATLPSVEELGAELARRRRERELAGKGKRTKPEAEEEDKPEELAAAA
ncbi:integrase [Methylorubrum rhodinum]|uniref:Integrase n=1 Tax=Methylorubrum rhodinum TaxID=29428 RepID=A0A840ZLP1_9HYPH|nr:integrase family protein [Methylorubrum rhodinum]MBB5758516.1 integrase [Methylorubrum rhodinum]